MFLGTPDKPLRQVLLESYLKPTAKWLLGSEQTPYLLPQSANSNWECALSIWFLLDLFGELDNSDPLRAKIATKVPTTARWIADQAARPSPDDAHWEGVTWDTAVCIRALLRALDQFPGNFSPADTENILSLTQKSLHWLISRFESWDTDVMYPYGPADVAQILITLLYVKTPSSQAVRVGKQLFDADRVDEAVHNIAHYLISAAEELKTTFENTTTSAPFWGDFFQSAETIDSLASYVQCQHGGLAKNDQEFVEECKRHVIRHIQYLEAHQVDGKWGTHSDTCRALYGYMRAATIIQGVGQEHHVVFKALRWMCDDKQTFSDGSFMHTTFITVFYALALWEVYSSWPLAALPVAQVYDMALWSAPVRATPERARRLELQIENQHLLSRNKDLEQQIKDLGVERETSRRSRRKIIASVLGTLAVIGAALSVAIATDLLVPSFSLNFKVDDPNAFLAYVGLVVVLVLSVAGGLYRFTR